MDIYLVNNAIHKGFPSLKGFGKLETLTFVVLFRVELRQYNIPKQHLQAWLDMVCGLIQMYSLLFYMYDDVPH